MKLYVINLDRSPDRLTRLSDIFDNMELDFVRIAAVDGHKLSDEEVANVTKTRLWPEPLTRGEVACFLSHRLCIEAIANGDDEYGTVFEDDVVFSKDAEFFLKNSDWILKDTDIVKLETHGKKTWLGPRIKLDETFVLEQLKSRHIMAAAYVISKTAAIRLLKLMDQAIVPFDHLFFNPKFGIFEQFSILQLDPAIVMQAKLKSTLEIDRAKIESLKKAKRSIGQTLTREIKRLVSRAKTGAWGLYINGFTKQSWKRVKFQSDK